MRLPSPTNLFVPLRIGDDKGEGLPFPAAVRVSPSPSSSSLSSLSSLEQKNDIVGSPNRRQRKRRRRQHVRFLKSANRSHDNTVMCKEEVSELWYKTNEYRAFRSERSRIAKQTKTLHVVWNTDNKSFPSIVSRIYNELFCHRGGSKAHLDDDGEDPYDRNLADDEDDEGNNAEDEDVQLLDSARRLFRTHWNTETNSSSPSNPPLLSDCWHTTPMVEAQHNDWLGLERLHCALLHKERHVRRTRLLLAIHTIQEEYLCNTEQKAILIARNCQAISRPSRLLATHLAQQLADVVGFSS